MFNTLEHSLICCEGRNVKLSRHVQEIEYERGQTLRLNTVRMDRRPSYCGTKTGQKIIIQWFSPVDLDKNFISP